ncbi:MAG TPA: hypothetical protein VGG01_22570 [Xanthobacteraceae bacterium]
MKLRTLLLACGASIALAGIASAQSPMPMSAPTRPEAMPRGYPPLPPYRVARMARASGFDPLFRPMRQGDTYVLRALDRNDVEYRLVIDAYTGRTMSVRATGHGEPGYGAYRGPVYGRIFGPRDDRYDSYGFGGPRPPMPPRVVPHARPSQANTQLGAQPSPAAQAAAPAPGSTTPLPRPRPYVMEATSSIPVEPSKGAEPQKAPLAPPAPQNPVPTQPAPAAPPADTPHSNGGASMPPVAPLD